MRQPLALDNETLRLSLANRHIATLTVSRSERSQFTGPLSKAARRKHALDIFRQHVYFDVQRLAVSPTAQGGLLRRVRDHCNPNGTVFLAGNRQRYTVERNRAFFDTVFSQTLWNLDPKIATRLGIDGPSDVANPINVTLDNMAAERFACPEGSLEVHRLANLRLPQPRAVESLRRQKELSNTIFLGHQSAARAREGDGVPNLE